MFSNEAHKISFLLYYIPALYCSLNTCPSIEEVFKSSPDIRAAETVDIEVEGKVHQLKVVGNCTEDLEIEVVHNGWGGYQRKKSRRSCAEYKEYYKRNEDKDQSSLVRTLKRQLLRKF